LEADRKWMAYRQAVLHEVVDGKVALPRTKKNNYRSSSANMSLD
jgi:hypothetical protein